MRGAIQRLRQQVQKRRLNGERSMALEAAGLRE